MMKGYFNDLVAVRVLDTDCVRVKASRKQRRAAK